MISSLLALAAVLLAATPLVRAEATYVDADATAGTGNTGPGAAFTADGNVNDSLWGPRTTFGNNGQIYQSTRSGAGAEDAPEISTTLTGLTPGADYSVYVNFWDATSAGGDTNIWVIRAGFSSGNLTLFGPDVDLPTTETFAASLASAVEAEIATATLVYSTPPLVFEGNRTLHSGFIGEAVADGAGQIVVYIDDLPALGASDTGETRTWYDGLSYEIVATPTGNIAMIVNNAGDLSAGFDQAMYDHLTSAGHTVELVSGGDVSGGTFTVADAEAKDILLISESISSSAADNLLGTDVPTLTCEAWGWDNLNFAGPADSAGTWQAGQTTINIESVTHPILTEAGLTAGALTYYTSAIQLPSKEVANLAPGAIVLATVSGDASFACHWAIEQGQPLYDNTPAPKRVVGFGLEGSNNPGEVHGDLSDDGWAFFDAAIQWLLEPSSAVPNSVQSWMLY
jgi:hypothetical protein